jgi:hypothetical protein
MKKILITFILFSIPFMATAAEGNINAFLSYKSVIMQEEGISQKSHGLVVDSNLFLGFPAGPFSFGFSFSYTMGAVLKAERSSNGTVQSIGLLEMGLPLSQGLGCGVGGKWKIGSFQLLCCLGLDLDLTTASAKEYDPDGVFINVLAIGPSISITPMFYVSENIGISGGFKVIYDAISPFYPSWILPSGAQVYSIMCGVGLSIKL